MTRGFARQVGILWDAENIETGDISEQVLTGRDPSVALFIKNGSGAAMTFAVECAGDKENGPGLNNTIADWYPYSRYAADDSIDPVVIAVAAGAKVCLDFETFTPSRIRLVVTHAAGVASGPVTAFTEHYGG